jgi:hypothetical protein
LKKQEILIKVLLTKEFWNISKIYKDRLKIIVIIKADSKITTLLKSSPIFKKEKKTFKA